jgi:hypothetical protein
MVSLPDSHVFELLARFPSTTYKIIERQVDPQNPPSSGYYASGQTMRFNLSAAVNEFGLVDSSSVDALTTAITTSNTNYTLNKNSKLRPAWRPGPSWISSIRETVNSGSLTTYENTDAQTINWFNCMRGALTRTPVKSRVGIGSYNGSADPPVGGSTFSHADVDGIFDADYVDLQSLTKVGFCNRSKRNLGFKVIDGGATNPTTRDIGLLGGFKNYSIPLTALGSIFQSNSVVPLGLFSTYSGQSYGLELKVASTPNAAAFATGGGINFTIPTEIYVVKPVIRMKILKILDETVMQAILQLYNKSESIEVVENMKIPLSLQMNSLKYNYHQYNLPANVQEYTINVPSTAASLRGIAFRIVKSTFIADITAGEPKAGLPLADESADQEQAIVYKFQLKIGSECIMESAVEQTTAFIGGTTLFANPCLNFFAKQIKKTGHLFSLLHHSIQAHDDVGGLEDVYMDSTVPRNLNLTNGDAPPGYMYAMNLENINHFENNNQSSGIDMRNYGSYNITLRVGVLNDAGNAGLLTGELKPLPNPYTLLLINAEDVVYEVSRSGVADITSQVL